MKNNNTKLKIFFMLSRYGMDFILGSLILFITWLLILFWGPSFNIGFILMTIYIFSVIGILLFFCSKFIVNIIIKKNNMVDMKTMIKESKNWFEIGKDYMIDNIFIKRFILFLSFGISIIIFLINLIL